MGDRTCVSAKFRTSGCFLVYATGIILIAAIVSPWVYWTVQASAKTVFPAILEKLEFHRVYNRVILVVAVAGIWPMWRCLAVVSIRQVGWVRHPAWWRHLATGFVVGIGSFSSVVIWALATGDDVITVNWSSAAMLMAVGKYMVVGCVVAVIEETYFRGGIQRTLQLAGGNVVLALILTSALYSGVHFMKMDWSKPVTWRSGFEYTAAVVSRPFQGQTVDVPEQTERPRLRARNKQPKNDARQNHVAIGFFTLFLAGCVMGVAFLRTGMLYLPVGLHAGWVLTNELCRWSTKGQGFAQIRDRWETWPVLVILLVAVSIWARPTDSQVSSATGDRSSS